MWVLNMEGLSSSTGTEVNATSNTAVCHHPVVLPPDSAAFCHLSTRNLKYVGMILLQDIFEERCTSCSPPNWLHMGRLVAAKAVSSFSLPVVALSSSLSSNSEK